MSIDHDKVLALLKQARAEYRDSDAAGDVLDWLEERALAQPAEAVEDITDLVMQPGAACPTCCQALHVDTDSDDLLQAKAHADEGWRLAHEWMRRAQAAEATHDAAQVAVAYRWVRNGEPVGRWIDGKPSPNEFEAAEHCKQLAEWTVEYAYTHPQAAPAQGGGWKLVPIEPTQRMKSDGLYTLDEVSKQAAGVSVGNLCGFAHMGAAYKAMLAAAPSQEGDS